MSGPRGHLFNTLKSICVPILQLGTQTPTSATSHRLIQLVDSLLVELNTSQSSLLDESLANYVFLPLSHLFRQQAKHPARLVELSISALTVLIQRGWKSKLTPVHISQLFILLVFILDPKPGSSPQLHDKPKPAALPEELQSQVLQALTALFRATHASPSAAYSLAEASLLPSLGHGIIVILEITTQSSPPIQLHALDALDAICSAIPDHEMLANFFPGIISSLARILSPPLSRSQKAKVLVQSLCIFQSATIKVFGDMQTRHISLDENEGNENGLSSVWLKATASQLGLVLLAVIKLKGHSSELVQQALLRMCIAFLDECHHSLGSCSGMLVETALVLFDISEPVTNTTLQDLASIYPEIGDEAKSIIYAWISSAPRAMQQQLDDGSRTQEIHNLRMGITLLQNLHLDTPTLVETLSIALRDIVTAVLRSTLPRPNILTETTSSRGQWTGDSLDSVPPRRLDFEPSLLQDECIRETRSELMNLLKTCTATQPHRDLLLSKLFKLLHESSGDEQVSSYWLALELIKSNQSGLVTHDAPSEMDTFFNFVSVPDDPSNAAYEMLHELYHYSVDIINRVSETTTTESNDQRVATIALETIALTSVRMGQHFKPELMDVLYPVTTFLGSRNQQVQSHAIVTLNILATSCGYPNVAELIVDNVDYMVNTVTLRLNALDISPATTQVLRTMVRLSGPRLVPFMEDVVDAIFGALENYHGYPMLVDGLFSVLNEVVAQGSRTGEGLLSFHDQACVSRRKSKPRWSTIKDISVALLKRQDRQRRREQGFCTEKYTGGHPTKPWKGLIEKENEKEPHMERMEEEEEGAPTPSYALLYRITTLTQHYLTSPTPQLRRSLLELVISVVPILATNEKEFLPLVNAIWPVIVDRIWDAETYVFVAACESLVVLCESAGDFLSSRFRTEWNKELYSWLYQAGCQDNVQAERKTAPSRRGNHDSKLRTTTGHPTGSSVARHSSFSQAAQRWEATKRLLMAMVLHIRIDEEMFDDICWLLADELEGSIEVRKALETRNDDTVWLVRYSRGLVNTIDLPKLVTGTLDFVRVSRKVEREF